MNCKYCGYEIDDNATFCATCGKVISENDSQDVVVETPEDAARRSGSGSGVLTFGILALAFAQTFFFSLLGIIFGAIAKAKASRYADDFGEVTGKALVGKILGTIGLILGIVLTVFSVIYVFIIVAALMLGA